METGHGECCSPPIYHLLLRGRVLGPAAWGAEGEDPMAAHIQSLSTGLCLSRTGAGGAERDGACPVSGKRFQSEHVELLENMSIVPFMPFNHGLILN